MLERVLDGSPRVVMELEPGIIRTRDRKPLLLQNHPKEQQTNGDGVSVAVEAYNHVLLTILDRFLLDASGIADEVKAEADS